MNITYDEMWRHLNDLGEGYSEWQTWGDVEAAYADDPDMEIIEQRGNDGDVMVVREFGGFHCGYCGRIMYDYIIIADANGPWAVRVAMKDLIRDIDPHGVLSTCEYIVEMVGDNLLTRDMVDAINEVINDWCEADPDGYDDAAAERMDKDIEYIIQETI